MNTVHAILKEDAIIRGMKYPRGTHFTYIKEAWNDGLWTLHMKLKTGIETVRCKLSSLDFEIVEVE